MVEMDGKVVEEKASFVLTSITPRYGGPIELTSKAIPDDGLFDVLVSTARVSPLRVMRMLSLAFLHRVGHAKGVTITRCNRVRISADEPEGREVPIQVDGDFSGYLPFEAEIVPGGMQYFSVS